MTWYLDIDGCAVDPQTKQGQCNPKCIEKEEYYIKKSSSVTQYLHAIFAKECDFKCRMKETYVQNTFTQHYFAKLHWSL